MWRKGNTLALFVKEKKVKVKSLSRVQHFVTPWTVAHQAPPSMGFSRQEYWNGLPFPSPGHLPDPGIKPRSSALQSDSLLSEPPGKPIKEGSGILAYPGHISTSQLSRSFEDNQLHPCYRNLILEKNRSCTQRTIAVLTSLMVL